MRDTAILKADPFEGLARKICQYNEWITKLTPSLRRGILLVQPHPDQSISTCSPQKVRPERDTAKGRRSNTWQQSTYSRGVKLRNSCHAASSHTSGSRNNRRAWRYMGGASSSSSSSPSSISRSRFLCPPSASTLLSCSSRPVIWSVVSRSWAAPSVIVFSAFASILAFIASLATLRLLILSCASNQSSGTGNLEESRFLSISSIVPCFDREGW